MWATFYKSYNNVCLDMLFNSIVVDPASVLKEIQFQRKSRKINAQRNAPSHNLILSTSDINNVLYLNSRNNSIWTYLLTQLTSLRNSYSEVIHIYYFVSLYVFLYWNNNSLCYFWNIWKTYSPKTSETIAIYNSIISKKKTIENHFIFHSYCIYWFVIEIPTF